MLISHIRIADPKEQTRSCLPSSLHVSYLRCSLSRCCCKAKVTVDCLHSSGLKGASSPTCSYLEQEACKSASGCTGSVSQPNHVPCSYIG